MSVMIVVAEGAADDGVLAALRRANERGAPTVLISNSSRPDPAGSEVMRFTPEAEKWLTPIPAIVMGQLFTYWLTVEQDNDPDHPRGLSKVTVTT